MENGKCAQALNLTSGIGMGSSEFQVVRTDKSKMLTAYPLSYLNRDTVRKFAESNMTGSSGHRRVPSDFYSTLPIPIPPLEIQCQIVAECETVDQETYLARAAIEPARQSINSEVEDVYGSNVVRRSVASLTIPTIAPQTKIQQNEILRVGTIPVVTQESINLISGFAPDGVDVITDLPLVVFGDHTCIFKFVDFSFVRGGADGTQLSKSDPEILNVRSFKFMLDHLEITNAEKYERHFKYLKNALIPVPPLNDQKRFAKVVEEQESRLHRRRNPGNQGAAGLPRCSLPP